MNKLIALVLSLLLVTGSATAADVQKEPIKIGGMYSYSGTPDWLGPAQKAAQMAVDEWNAAGGFNGRQAELVLRDDRGDPADAVQAAQELVDRDHVVALTGVSWTNVSLAVANVADRMNIPYIPGWCWKDTCPDLPNKSVFLLDSHPEAMMTELADWAAKQPVTRWGILIPTEEFAYTAQKYFEKELKKRNPKAEIVDFRTYQYGTNHFAQIVRIMKQKKVEAVFNGVTAPELPKYLRAARLAGFDKGILTTNIYLPNEGLVPMKDEAPRGWYVLNYPSSSWKTPENTRFVEAFNKVAGQDPGHTALVAYISTKFVLDAIQKTKNAEASEIKEALSGLTIDTPAGPVTMNAKTRRSNLGYWYGYTDVQDKKPVYRDVKRGATE